MKPSELSDGNKLITEIARKYLRVPTLETRMSDSLDFYDLAVWQVREVLEAAYRAGMGASEDSQRGQQKQE